MVLSLLEHCCCWNVAVSLSEWSHLLELRYAAARWILGCGIRVEWWKSPCLCSLECCARRVRHWLLSACVAFVSVRAWMILLLLLLESQLVEWAFGSAFDSAAGLLWLLSYVCEW